MYVPAPLDLPRLKLSEAVKGVEVVVTHFYADSYPNKIGVVISSFELNGKQRVKVHMGTNRAGQKLIKQFPINVLALRTSLQNQV
jgi:hypothetical protein